MKFVSAALVLALIASISGCDSPFFDFITRPTDDRCPYGVDFRLKRYFPAVRPTVSIDSNTCDFLVDASVVDPSYVFMGRVKDGEVTLDEGPCRVDGDLSVQCGDAMFTFVEKRALPFTDPHSFCLVGDCSTSLMPNPEYRGNRLPFKWTLTGYFNELVTDPDPIAIANATYQVDVSCPTQSRETRYAFVETSTDAAGRPCVHLLERSVDAYVGVYGSTELRVARFDPKTLRVLQFVPLVPLIGEELGKHTYSVTSLDYDPDHDAIAIALISTSRTFHLLLFAANSLALLDHEALPPISADETNDVFGIRYDRNGWLYANDGNDTLVRVTADDLGQIEWSRSISDVRGRSDLGSVLAIENGSVTINSIDEELVFELGGEIEGSAGAIFEVVLTPSAIVRAGDLIAVGLLDKLTTKAYVAFFDPETLHFLPGAIEIGTGIVGRMRFTESELWVALPWQGSVVRLDAASN